MPTTPTRLPDAALLAAAVLDALPGQGCVIDADGIIVQTNRGWREFARANRLATTADGGAVGSNYLEIAEAASGECAEDGLRAAAGLRSVLTRGQTAFTMDYACHAPNQMRWYRMTATPLAVGVWHGALVLHQDITREVVEQRARQRIGAGFEAYRLLFDANPEPMWVYDVETLRFVAVNQRALTRYGYTRDEFLRLGLLDIRPAAEHGALLADISQAEQPEMQSGSWTHRARDGSEFTVRVTSHAVEWSGRPARLVLAEDITKRLETERALRESEQRFRQMADNLSEVFWLSDIASGELLYVSPAYERIWGRSVAELLADPQQWMFAVHPDDRDRVNAAFGGLHDGGFDLEFSVVRPDGEMRRIAARAAPIVDADGVARRAAGAARDITVHHGQTQRLRLLELAVARLNDIVLITEAEPCDEPGPRIVFVNDAFERRTGYTREEVIGLTPRVLQGKATQRAELDRIRAALEAWQPVRAELINYTKDGKPFWVELDIVPLADASGWYTHWVSVERDITERKALEEQARQSQRLESLGQLTGGVAHDFNNLLTVMLGNAEVLAERLALGTSEQRLAEMICGAAQRGADLTQRLLAFARKQPLQPRATDLNRLLGDLEGLLGRSLGEHIEVEVVRAAGLWSTHVDPAQVENAILNMGINARDAMPEGGRLTLETANVHLDEDYVRPHLGLKAGQYVMLAVTDTGTGIAPEHLSRVFEPFFTTKEKGKGTGLGLAMVYGFVKQSGGHIAIYSELARGTVVRVYLPRQIGGPQVAEAPAADESRYRGESQLILLVEDDAMVREFACGQLQSLGYRVLEAADGNDGLALLQRHDDIALLFTDIVMPGGMSGRVLADAAQALRPQLPVLYTSGYTENAIVHHGRLDPGVMLLSKPYRRSELARKVHQALNSAAGAAR